MLSVQIRAMTAADTAISSPGLVSEAETGSR
jgi:hypothetical protein